MCEPPGSGCLVCGYNISFELIHLYLKPARKFNHAVQVNLGEEEISSLNVNFDGSIEIPVLGYKIISILFRD